MRKIKATNFKEFEAALLQDPEIFKDYMDLKPKYDLAQELLKKRNKFRPDR
ncbi:MAG: hypothetical protein JXA46_18400 [Dehalococcoidales bacterium]|nr:hypothetical protein [Dehalococcoidales bacterium]